MKSQKVILLILILLLLFTNNQFVYSQSAQDSVNNTLEKGSWSLQFQIEDNFNSSSFQGINLSAQNHPSANCTIRFGISLCRFSKS